MNSKIIIGIIAVIIIVGVSIMTLKGGDAPKVATNGRIYCSSEGMMTTTIPIQSHRSYCIKSNSDNVTFSPKIKANFIFSIVDDRGGILKDFDTVHEKIMHLIVVRKDLANFQHVHPEYDFTTGEFTLSHFTLPSDGEYRIFADFTPTAGVKDTNDKKLPVTIFQDVQVGNMANYQPQTIGDTASSKTFGDDYRFTLITNPLQPTTGSESKLTFDIWENGKPVTDLEQYLGALGHLILVREGDLQFIHGHPIEDPKDPQSGKVSFKVSFPETGKYKIFAQFKRQGKTTMTDFVVEVALGQDNGSGADHGGDSTTH